MSASAPPTGESGEEDPHWHAKADEGRSADIVEGIEVGPCAFPDFTRADASTQRPRDASLVRYTVEFVYLSERPSPKEPIVFGPRCIALRI